MTNFEIEKKGSSLLILDSFTDLLNRVFPNIQFESLIVKTILDSNDNPFYKFVNINDLNTLKNQPVYTGLIEELGKHKSLITSIQSRATLLQNNGGQSVGIPLITEYIVKNNEEADQITFSIPNHVTQPISPKTREYLFTFQNELPNFFTIKTKQTSRDFHLNSLQKERLNFYEKEIYDISLIKKEMLETISTQTKEWNQALLDTQRKLEEQFVANKEKLNNEYREKEEKLKRDVIEFEERKKQFDDRDRTVVRRDLLNKIKGAIDEQEEFDLSKATRGKRHWVTGALAVGLLFSAGIMITLLNSILQKDSAPWQLYVFLGTSTLGFISTLIYALRWTTQWYYDHSEIEFANQKFKKDILRASWIVEMFFEWKEQKQFDMPVEIYNAISKNLFNERSSSKQINHPIEDLLKITGKFSKVKLGKDGIEVENSSKDKA